MSLNKSASKLKDLVIALNNNHYEIRRQLWILHMLVSKGDYDLAEKRASQLWTFVDSCFAKEEAWMHDVVKACVSIPSSNNPVDIDFKNEEPIEYLKREHVALSDSFREIQNITRFSSEWEAISSFDKFERTLTNYLMQESRAILSMLIEKSTYADKENRAMQKKSTEETENGKISSLVT